MTVSRDQYNEEKERFFSKHNGVSTCITSSMDSYGRYSKEYICNDGFKWYESMGPVYVQQEVEINKCKVLVEVKMLRTEFFSAGDSKYYYEEF